MNSFQQIKGYYKVDQMCFQIYIEKVFQSQICQSKHYRMKLTVIQVILSCLTIQIIWPLLLRQSYVWQVQTGKLTNRLNSDSKISFIKFNNDGNFIYIMTQNTIMFYFLNNFMHGGNLKFQQYQLIYYIWNDISNVIEQDTLAKLIDMVIVKIHPTLLTSNRIYNITFNTVKNRQIFFRASDTMLCKFKSKIQFNQDSHIHLSLAINEQQLFIVLKKSFINFRQIMIILNSNKCIQHCDLDLEMEVHIKQANVELENLLNIKKRILVQQKLIQQHLDDIQMLIRKQTKQIRNIIDEHQLWVNSGYSECQGSDYQQYKKQILEGFANLSSRRIYQNLINNLEWVSGRVQLMTQRIEQNFSQYFKNTEVFLPNTNFFTCMINYDYRHMKFNDDVLAASISNDQKILICSSKNKELGVWDLFTFCESKRISVSYPINTICFSKFDNVVYLGSIISVQIMDLNNFNIIQSMCAHNNLINLIEKEQNVLITWSQEQLIEIINIKTRDYLLTIKNDVHAEQINNIDYSQKYDVILGSSQSQIRLWEAKNGKQIVSFETDLNILGQTHFSQKQDKIVAISYQSNQVNVYNYDNQNRTLILFNKYIAESNLRCISWTQQDIILACIIEDQICFIPVLEQNQKQSKCKYVDIQIPKPQFVQQPDSLRNLFFIKGKSLIILEQQYQEELISYQDFEEQII
ncbi:hypothetical protein pb186bvf_000268 [Paramecium bursaria]